MQPVRQAGGYVLAAGASCRQKANLCTEYTQVFSDLPFHMKEAQRGVGCSKDSSSSENLDDRLGKSGTLCITCVDGHCLLSPQELCLSEPV